jgi:hypothetical protein
MPDAFLSFIVAIFSGEKSRHFDAKFWTLPLPKTRAAHQIQHLFCIDQSRSDWSGWPTQEQSVMNNSVDG